MSNSNITHRAISPISNIKQAIDSARSILVVSHIDPDGDALGSILSVGAYLKDLGKDVSMVRESDLPGKYLFLPGIENVLPLTSLPDDYQPDLAVLLECPSLDRAGDSTRWYRQSLAIVNIDHHQDAEEYGEINWIDVTASSVGEMICEYFEAVGYEISPEVAICLYTAILTDTGRFRFESTSPRTLELAGRLVKLGAQPRKICDQVYFDLPESAVRLTGEVLRTMELHHNNTVCILSLPRETAQKTGASDMDSDGLSDYTLYTKGVTRGALLKEIDANTTKISLRARYGREVSTVAAMLGGGGHNGAAGCTVNLPLNEAKTKIIGLLKEDRRRNG